MSLKCSSSGFSSTKCLSSVNEITAHPFCDQYPFYFLVPDNHLQKTNVPTVTTFCPQITEPNYWALELPHPNQGTQPTKPQQGQPLISHHRIGRGAPKARALRGSIKSCQHHNTKRVTQRVRRPQRSGNALTGCSVGGEYWKWAASPHPHISCIARSHVGAFLRPLHTGTGKPTIFPNPPGRKLGEPAGALTLEEQDAQQWEQSAATASTRSALLHPDSSLDACTPCLQLPVTTQVIPEVTSGREVARTLQMAIRGCHRNVATFQGHTWNLLRQAILLSFE